MIARNRDDGKQKQPRKGTPAKPNDIRLDGSTVWLTLTDRRKQYRTETAMDLLDWWEFARFHRWHVHTNGTGRKYVTSMIDGRRIYLHRAILNPPDGMLVDHIDGDPLNNCRSNLRAVTPAENCVNREGRGSSRFRGVWIDRRTGRWIAAVYRDGSCVHRSYHSEEVDAAAKVDEIAADVWGDVARRNIQLLQPRAN